MEDYLNFTKNGVTYTAYKGHAHARKFGKTIWSKDGVFCKNEVTEKGVLELNKFMERKSYEDDWFKKQHLFD